MCTCVNFLPQKILFGKKELGRESEDKTAAIFSFTNYMNKNSTHIFPSCTYSLIRGSSMFKISSRVSTSEKERERHEKRNPPCHLHFDFCWWWFDAPYFVNGFCGITMIIFIHLGVELEEDCGQGWDFWFEKNPAAFWCQIIFRILSYKIFFIPCSP